MSDPINANPTVIDVANLPTRDISFRKNEPGQDLVERITALSLRVPHDLNSAPDEETPDLVSDSGESFADSDEEEDPIDAQEVFDLIATISDPEHPLTLAQLAVVNLPDISVTHGATKNDLSEVLIRITPTITHCSLATLIGLGIRVRLDRCLPPRFRIRILIKEGTHQSENQVNKQLNDKERVAAACENDQLLSVISQMLSSCK